MNDEPVISELFAEASLPAASAPLTQHAENVAKNAITSAKQDKEAKKREFDRVLGRNEVFATHNSVMRYRLAEWFAGGSAGRDKACLFSRSYFNHSQRASCAAKRRCHRGATFAVYGREEPPTIAAIKICYTNDVIVEWLPQWLIEHFGLFTTFGGANWMWIRGTLRTRFLTT